MNDSQLISRLKSHHTVIARTVVGSAREAQALETRAMDADLAVEARDWPCSVARKDVPPANGQIVELVCPKDRVADLMELIEGAPDASDEAIALHVIDPAMGSFSYEMWADAQMGGA